MIFYRHFRAKVDALIARDGAAGDQAGRARARRAQVTAPLSDESARAAGPRDEPEINFIPLIDVLLVILIFLMVTTTYQRVAELQITLPEADAEPMQQRPKEINVGVDAQGQYVIDKTLMHVHDRRRARRRAEPRRGRRQGPGRHHQRRRQRDAPVGDPRDGGRASGRLDPHHVRDPDCRQVTGRPGADRSGQAVRPEPVKSVTHDRLVAAWYSPRLTPLSRRARSGCARCSAPRPSSAARFIACGVFRIERLPVPVIVVGNITVGGSGKTPLYDRAGERARAPRLASRHRQPRLSGDEPRAALRSASTTIRTRSATSRCCSRGPACRCGSAPIAPRRRARCSRPTPIAT